MKPKKPRRIKLERTRENMAVKKQAGASVEAGSKKNRQLLWGRSHLSLKMFSLMMFHLNG